MYKKDVWPDIHPDSWFTLQFSQLALKHSPNLRSFGLTRTLTSQPVLASIPLQEKDTLLPAAASYEQNPQCHFHRPVLALPAASWPSPRQRPCACISQVRSRMPETFSFASFQSPEMRPLDAPIVWLCCSSKRLPSVLVYSLALELQMYFLKEIMNVFLKGKRHHWHYDHFLGNSR